MLKRILVSSAVCLLAAASLLAQNTPGPAFEVASIKPSNLDIMKLAQQIQAAGKMPKIGAVVEGTHAQYIFMGLKELIAEAYKVKPYQITGPDWLNTTGLSGQRFDIDARMPEGSTKDQAPAMLQALLAERFKMVLHRDEKEHPVLALVVGKGGPKLKESPEGTAQDIDPATPLKPGEQQIDTPEGPMRMTTDTATGTATINMGKRGKFTEKLDPSTMTLHIETSQTTMSAFADMLTQLTQMTGGSGTQVVDMTDLKGSYVVGIDFSLADLMKMAQTMGIAIPGGNPLAGGSSPAEAASDPGGSTINAAVQALGLKLESRKAPTLQLVIDHIEKMPTEN